MTVHIIPIEPLEERYSAQWLKWFASEVQTMPLLPYSICDPSDYLTTGIGSTIKHGQFLDIIDTCQYKSKQLSILIDKMKFGRVVNGDTFLFLDGWFPGVELVAYIRDGLGLKVKFVALFHAGTYDPADFLTQKGMEVWGKHLENSWFALYDKIIVATQYHKDLLIKTRKIDPQKISVVFFPMKLDWLPALTPRNNLQVVFPHRLAPEKQPELFKELEELNTDQQLTFVCTKRITSSKKRYWEILRQSTFAVSTALQETWGIAMIESVLAGCIPIVPDRLSYSELYPSIFKYPGTKVDNVVELKYKLDCLKVQLSREPHLIATALSSLQQKFAVLGHTAIPTILSHCC